MKKKHRTTIATYVSSQRHLRGDCRGAKTLTQMAKEIGTTKSTVSRWLRRDHWALWMEHWASVEEIWEAAQRDRQRLPQQERRAKQDRRGAIHGQALVAHLDRSLVETVERRPARCTRHDLERQAWPRRSHAPTLGR